jgi:hypothetical protein
MKKANVLVMLSLLTTAVFSTSGFNSYYGSKGNKLVVLQVSDSLANIEYCYIDFKGSYISKFDTLKFIQDKYVGKFSKVLAKNNGFIFKPGDILLHQGIPDSSFNKMRNLGYLRNINLKYNAILGWTGFKLDELNVENCSNNTSLNPETFRKNLRLAYDSLIDLYTSIKTTEKFNKLIIQDCRLFQKTYLESTDSSEIYRIWGFLATGKPKKNSMMFYFLQYPIAVLPFTIIFNGYLDFGLSSTIFVYPALIGFEKLIVNTIYSGSTYKVIFINQDKKKIVIKIRKSVLLGDDYNYILPFSFEKNVLNEKAW